ncbi:mannosyltransferase [Amycolatopsis thailandensis]|uniref:Mannosyltransferase n=1 Tax=Amycolatopsis thailandensis TaxID=589330 RepID=A0A229RY31_9PSEU|nr:mannosyltransferase [Amycolatopsis thailandensis]
MWHSPADQPRWARPVLLGITAVAAVLYAWNLPVVDLAPLYSDAVKSMSGSWKAFLFGAVDAEATATLDKLAGSFVPQVVSAKIFGYSEWSLALPQVIEGVISVLVMYRVVRRWAGVVPGLLAAGIFTLTPVAASMFGHSMQDGLLTMCLVLAVDAYQRAVLEGRLRSLVWAGVWVGLGFQAKMLQAWMILPALAIGYLLSAPTGLRRRVKHVAIAGAVTLAVSLSWIALFTLTPASSRPYVDGSTNNSAFAMVFGYNGLSHLGIELPGARKFDNDGGAIDPQQRDIIPAKRGNPDEDPTKATSRPVQHGGAKLFDGHLAVAVGWLYPLVLLTLLRGLWWRRRAERSDPVRGGLVMWGVWLLTFGLVFSVADVPHTAYVASLTPAVAALSALGIVLFWRAYREGGKQAWLLPLAVAAEVAWAAWLWSHYPNFLPWAKWGALALGVAAVVALVLTRVVKTVSPRLVTAGLAVGVAAVMAAPATYAISVLDPDYSGMSFDANAGPESGRIPAAPPAPANGAGG